MKNSIGNYAKPYSIFFHKYDAHDIHIFEHHCNDNLVSDEASVHLPVSLQLFMHSQGQLSE